jgi:hypothetical protein
MLSLCTAIFREVRAVLPSHVCTVIFREARAVLSLWRPAGGRCLLLCLVALAYRAVGRPCWLCGGYLGGGSSR